VISSGPAFLDRITGAISASVVGVVKLSVEVNCGFDLLRAFSKETGCLAIKITFEGERGSPFPIMVDFQENSGRLDLSIYPIRRAPSSPQARGMR
jgi:hypothetical protein